jgi:SAM-dependent methyltransferase
MGRFVGWLDQRFYPNFSTNWDDSLMREAVLRRIGPTTRLLDLGAGAGIVAQMDFKARVARACGVDLDARVMENPHLHEAKVGSGERIPYGDGEFDVVIADNVLEHLEKPVEVFREVCRVLKAGGYFIAKTPNRAHYVPVISRLTPLWFHRAYNRLRGRETEDTFPTFYRANSRVQIEALASAAGLQTEAVHLVEGRPEYLRLSPVTYLAGIAYERTVNMASVLAGWRVLLIAELRKPEAIGANMGNEGN